MIKVEDSVHSEMKSVGAYGESFSDIISKCVRAFKEKQMESGMVREKLVERREALDRKRK